MLNCPFCNADLADQGLTEGRCPNCGVVLAWSDEPAPPPSDVPARASSQPTYQDTIEIPLAAHSSAPPNEGAGQPPSPDTVRTIELPGSEGIPSQQSPVAKTPAPRKTAPRLADDTQKVTAIWQRAVADAPNYYATIKTDHDARSPTHNLVVRSHHVAELGAPAAAGADYELLEVIGQGGVGVVYAARQGSIDRTVAVKMLRSQEMNNQEQHDKFLAEAVVTGELDHPNIVPIYDLGSNQSGALFYSMKRVQGTPWNKVIQANTLTQNLEILMKVADAVAFAHSRGVIHRDIKPENVMIGDFGEVLVMDWGIALSTSANLGKGGPLKSTSMGGTPAYMAPEMATGPIEMIGPRSDVYLLGAVLYEAMSGHPPHSGDDVMACLLAAARNEIVSTPQNGELMDIAMRAMSTDIEARFETVQDFQRAIRRYQSHNESLALSAQAEKDLEKAHTSRDYEDFARAVFGFEQAIALWRGNASARKHLVVAKLAYAEAALDRKDFDLGLSLLDPKFPEHATLHATLTAAQQERNAQQKRDARNRRLVRALLGAIFVIVSCGFVIVLNYSYKLATTEGELRENNYKLVESNKNEKKLRDDAEKLTSQVQDQNKQLAGLNENLKSAVTSEKQAREGMATALEQLQATRRSELEQGYASAINLSAEKIDDFIVGDARRELTKFLDPEVSGFRHWEWGYLMSLCHLAAAEVDLPDRIECVASDPSGTLLAAGDTAGNIRIWLASDGAEFNLSQHNRVLHHGEAVFDLAISRDGRFLASAGRAADGAVKLWDLRSDQGDEPLLAVTEITGVAYSVEFSANGRRLLTAGDDGAAQIWTLDPAARRVERSQTLSKHLGIVWSAAFDRTESHVVTAGNDGLVIVWPLAQPTALVQFAEHEGPVFAAKFSPDGLRVASAGEDGRILVWEPERIPKFNFESLRAVGDYRPEVLQAHTSAVRSLSFSPQGDLLISAGHDNTVRLWDLSDGSTTGDTLSRLRVQEGREAQPLGVGPPPSRASGDTRLLKTFRGHGGWVRATCFVGADAMHAVSGGYYQNGQIKLWNILAYRDPRMLHGHTGPIQSLAISHDGKWIVTSGTSSSGEGETLRFNLDRGDSVSSLGEGHAYMAMRAVFPRAPEGSRNPAQLLTVAGDDTLRAWNVDRGGEVYSRLGAGRFGTLAVSPDAGWIVTGGESNTAKVYRGLDGRMAQELRGHFGTVTAAGFSQDSTWLATGDANGQARLWSLGEGGVWMEKLRLTGHAPGRGIVALAFPANRERLLTAGSDGRVVSWDIATGKIVPGEVLTHPDPVALMNVSHDGRYVITACALAVRRQNQFVSNSSWAETGEAHITRLFLWDLEGSNLVRSKDLRGQIAASAEFAEDDRSILVAIADESKPGGWLRQWSVESGDFRPMWSRDPSLGAVWSASYVPSKVLPDAIITVGGKRARIWRASNGALLRDLGAHRGIGQVAVSPSDQYVATGGVEGNFKVWNAANRDVIRSYTRPHAGRPIVGLTFLPESEEDSWIVSLGGDGFVRIWRLTQPGEEPEEEWRTLIDNPTSLAVSPDGRLVAVGHEDGSVEIRDRTDGPLEAWKPRRAHPERIASLKFSDDGRQLVTASYDYRAKVFDVTSGRELMVLEGHAAPVTSIDIAADGMRVVTGSRDETVKVWNIEAAKRHQASASPGSEESPITGRELLTLRGKLGEINAVSFSPRGDFVAAASNVGKCVIWPADEVVSLRLTANSRDYRLEDEFVLLDPNAQIMAPTVGSLAGWSLHTVIENSVMPPGGGLDLRLADDTRIDENGLIQRRDETGQWVHIARLDRQGDGQRSLSIRWLDTATLKGATAIVRSIVYYPSSEDASATDDGRETKIRFHLAPDEKSPSRWESTEILTLRPQVSARMETSADLATVL